MPCLALTGGIASGKSTVAGVLAGIGATVISADELARELQATGSPLLSRLTKTFGEGILLPGGGLDRARLADIVFADDGARKRLNALMHPQIRRLARERIDRLTEQDPGSIVVYEIPLLAETVDGPGIKEFDLVLLTQAKVCTRLRRLIQRGLSPSQAQARLADQALEKQRLALADVVFNSDKPFMATKLEVLRFWLNLPQILHKKAQCP